MKNDDLGKIPSIRFKGFTNAWELRRLTDIVNRVSIMSNSDELPKVEFEDIVSGEGRLNKDISNKFDQRKGILFQPEYILYGKLRPYLKNWFFPSFKGVALGDFWVFESINGSIPVFNFYLIQSDNYQQVANDTSGTKMPRSDWKNVSSTNFAIPNELEQHQIGTFFQTLDNLITLHQRKLDKTKELKKTMVSKMFPKNDEDKPELRFSGFTDAWELRRLGDLLVERNIQVPENEEYPLMSFVQGLGVTPKGDRYDRSFLVTSSEKKYKVTEYGDFIYSSNNLETGSIGFNRTGKAVISPVYSIFYSKNNLESRYIGILSTRKDFIAKMIRYRQGVIYGQWRIHESDFLEIKILIPTEKEQKEIIQTFDTLDNLITLHQRELEQLKNIKKTLLKHMFV